MYSAIVLAAGSGSRMNLGYNKMFFECSDGLTIIEKSVDVFYRDPRCNQIIITCSSDDMYDLYELFGNKVQYALGGQTRAHSVYNALHAVKNEYVMIHDGARPWVPRKCIDEILEVLPIKKACILAMPVKDTIKVVKDGLIETTPKRSTLYLAQTPQAFETNLILKAYHDGFKQGVEVSDDASMVELCSDYDVSIVEGSYENIKVTTIEDVVGK